VNISQKCIIISKELLTWKPIDNVGMVVDKWAWAECSGGGCGHGWSLLQKTISYWLVWLLIG